MAAIPALEAGLNVTICEKGRLLDNCGSVGCGVDHYLTVMESGYEWDTPEFLIKHLPELTVASLTSKSPGGPPHWW